MGETRVDLLHLLEDLADAYPGALEETVLTEIVANSLDSGATAIAIHCDPTAATLAVIDNGVGMRRAELRRFHDVAASTKTRGDGIGFAGVGIKLGLLVSSEVMTESRRGKDHVATTWALLQRKRAPWHWITPPALVGEHGTAVRLRLENPLSPLLDAGFVEALIRRHFEPLLDPYFDDILRDHYPAGVRFEVNTRPIERRHPTGEGVDEVPVVVRLARKRKPSASGYLRREGHPLPDTQRGVAISTLGKVIKRGWDWLGVSPVSAERVSGLIEVPSLASTLTLNKVDFIRTGPRGATYMSYRKALQQAVGDHLSAWGDSRADQEQTRRRAARPVERDVEQVLIDLAEAFPLLAMLVERRSGGQRKLPIAEPANAGGQLLEGDLFAPGDDVQMMPEDGDVSANGESPAGAESVAPTPPADESADSPSGASADGASAAEMPARRGRRRPTRLGLTIQFESQPDLPGLGRLLETTVWVNEAHPAYRRAVASRSEGYHIALSVAMALASVAVEPTQANAFVTEFLARWGASVENRDKGKRPGRKRG